MARKRQEYCSAGMQIVWQGEPRTRTVKVFTAPDQSTVLHMTHMLGGGTVLPGFTLPLQELFAALDLQGEA
jgi:Uma2 family endonuclease